MKKLSLLIFMATVCGTARAQHLPNGNFEVWKQACGNTYQSSPTNGGTSGTPAGDRQRPGQEPEFWNGSSINQKVLMEKKETLITKEDNNGSSVVKMENKFVGVWGIGSNAPAFITFATPWVYAITNISNCDGGAYGGMTFGFRPDAIRGVYKRTTGSDGEEKAHIIAYLWKGTYTSKIVSVAANEDDKIREDVDRVIMKKAEPITAGTLIASCDYEFTSTANNDWEEIIVPLVYEPGQENVIPEKMNVVLSSADYWTRSNIKKGNILEADDVDFVYYSQLASLSYNGTPVAGFDKDVYAYTIDGAYTYGCLEAVKNCAGGTCTVDAYDAATRSVTITVKGDDWSETNKNEHSYVVSFTEDAQDLMTVYSNSLSVNFLGNYMGAPQNANIEVSIDPYGVYSLSLKNFALEGIGGVGNIDMAGLTVTEQNGGLHLSANKGVAITEGDDPTIDEWMGPTLTMMSGGAIPVAVEADIQGDQMTASIDIDFTTVPNMESFGVIKVVFAPELTITDDACTLAASGLYNIVLQRQFKKGWNTVCLPYAVTPAALGASVAQAFSGADATGLIFAAVENMEAHTPYLIFFDNAVSYEQYAAGQVEAATPQSVTYGDFTFTGTYEPMSMAGKYGVATVDGVDKIVKGGANATVKGTRAYFTSTNANIKEMPLLIDGVATGVAGVQAAEDAAYDVYTLTGIQVRKGATTLGGLPKGIYIVNGKKMYIK